jgi:hypothetical protein
MAMDVPALHAIGPIDVGVHDGEDGVDVAGVEGTVRRADEAS